MRKIRKGDKVKVIAGKDKGRVGIVLQVLDKSPDSDMGLSVIVQGINVKKRHVKGNPQQQKPGGVIPRESAMPACKVALLDPVTNKPSRVGIKALADGTKVRVFKSSGEVVDA